MGTCRSSVSALRKRIQERSNFYYAALIGFGLNKHSFGTLEKCSSSLPGKHGLEEFTQSCTIVKDHDGRSPKTLLMTIGVVLPTSILVIANSMIYYKVSGTVSELTQVEVALTSPQTRS